MIIIQSDSTNFTTTLRDFEDVLTQIELKHKISERVYTFDVLLSKVSKGLVDVEILFNGEEIPDGKYNFLIIQGDYRLQYGKLIKGDIDDKQNYSPIIKDNKIRV